MKILSFCAVVACGGSILLFFPFLRPATEAASFPSKLFVVLSETAPLEPSISDGVETVSVYDDFLLAVSSSPEAFRALSVREDLEVRTIDIAPKSKDDYYLLECVADPGVVAKASGVPVLFRHGRWTLFRASPEGAVSFASKVGVLDGVGHRCGNLRKVPLRPVFSVPEGEPESLALGSVDPFVQSLVAQVDTTRLLASVQELEDFGGRRYDSAGGSAAENAVKAWYDAFVTPENQMTVSRQLFQAGWHRNVVAVLPGAVRPEEYVIVGAHYDSICNDGCSNPYGADDNATGSATVREIARILSSHEFERTIVFCAWGAEEVGLVGSSHYASQARSQGDEIYGYLNFDMNGYRQPGNPMQFSVATNSSSASLIAELRNIRDLYVSDVAWVEGVLLAGSSDHASFTSQGYRACFPFENFTEFTPHIHTGGDRIGPSVNDIAQSGRFCELGVAAIATWAIPFDGLFLDHTALTNTADALSGRVVTARAVAEQGIDRVELCWENGGAGEVTISMSPTGQANEYSSVLPAHPFGTKVSYFLRVVDLMGADEVLPAGAPVSRFSYQMVPEHRHFFDDMEAGTNGWTHAQVQTQDDWMLGPPNQQGTNPSDPLLAWSGSNVWGNDLNPPGFQGDYPNNVHNYLESPSIDLSTASGSKLRYRRWLTVEGGQFDQARILLNGSSVWENPFSGNLLDTEWTEHVVDLSSADGSGSARVRFELISDAGLVFGGWNLDDVEVFSAAVSPSMTPSTGMPALGSTLTFSIEASARPGKAYELFAARRTTPGIDVDGERIIPLRVDSAYQRVETLKPDGNAVRDWTGVLDGTGSTGLPSLRIPGAARYSGLEFFISGVIYDTNGTDVLDVLPFVKITLQ